MNKKDLVITLSILAGFLGILILGDYFGIFHVRMIISIPALIVGLILICVISLNIIAQRYLFPLREDQKMLLTYGTAGISLITITAAFVAGHTFFTWIGIVLVFLLASLKYSNEYFSQSQEVDYVEENKPKFSIDPWIIGIGILFVIIRLGVLVYYKASYLDEYLHIFTGASWLNGNFHEIYKGIEYYRGIYLTAVSAVTYKIFGFSFFAQKAIPLLLSCLNFAFFARLTKKYITDKWVRYIAIFTYAIVPILIFNATYLRTYIFFETFAYISFFLLLKVVNAYESAKWKNFSIYAVVTVLFAGFILFTRDIESMLFLLILGIGAFAYLVFTANKNFQFELIKKLPLKHGYILLLAGIVLPFLNVNKYLDVFLNGQLTNGDGGVQKYIQFFFVDHLFFTIFFITLFIIALFEKNLEKKIFYTVVAFLFVFHNLITADFRTLRGIFYFFPFFIVCTFVVIEKLYKENSILKFVVAGIIALSPLFTIGQYFINGPGIPKEIDYFPFSTYYETVKTQCKDRKVLSMMHSNYISDFYGVQPHSIIYLRQEQLNADLRYYKSDSGIFYQSVDNIPVIMKYTDVENLIKKEKVCVLLTTDFRHTGLYITGNDYSALFGNFTTTQVKSLKILTN